MLFSSIFGAVVVLAAEAAAHGAVTSYIIAGKNYPGCESSLTIAT